MLPNLMDKIIFMLKFDGIQKRYLTYQKFHFIY
ncbi:hypothetical protein CLV51_107144 [Chitinophaga niastensis]|uniref:Uncharacterized protein n=1 Tax=Chitinophaga niastensis TaxID=536980 RepID=A0A2P8HC72_CHINA|nr:hypothetical protein CLV51_107144 [Chitinophaga niastensis]